MRAAITRVCELLAAGDMHLELKETLEALSEALIPDARKREMENLRRRVEDAQEVKGICWLACRDQSAAYSPR